MAQHNKRRPKLKVQKETLQKYLEFVILFNKFINHRRKAHQQFMERDMRL